MTDSRRPFARRTLLQGSAPALAVPGANNALGNAGANAAPAPAPASA